MMRALIVDDEIYAREEMESLLREAGEFTVCGKCANAIGIAALAQWELEEDGD